MVPVILLTVWANQAVADLYRWVDPETGSVKFSSYPPPWYGDAARARGAPKVEVIAPTRTPPAAEPGTGTDRDGAPASADGKDAPPPAVYPQRNDPRNALLKQLSQRVAALISSAPEAMGKAYVDLLEPLQQLERLDRQLKSSEPKGEAARLEEKWQTAVPLEAHRSALLQKISSLSPPPVGSPGDQVERAWLDTQRLLAALEWTNGAINSIDPRKADSRRFEMSSLVDKLVALWEPYVDPSPLRRNRGR